ncbi:MAG: CDP-diacylglycerol--serine O-phosphatidyltransferase [Deltaproteobacteria bacterium]|nr:MAG: CDP-diacylglycerol--serine O-phosphatidyltransferase [Deltaproteobacteria bacterium]
MVKKKDLKFILPSLFTVSSIFCGMYAIFQAVGSDATDRFYKAAVAVIFAILFDSADGRVARLTNSQSSFGIQLDSLADAISFGVAPAVIVYQWGLFHFGLLGMAVAFVYTTCGVIRLARFNLQAMSSSGKAGKNFTGLPIPLAAANLMGLVLLHQRTGGQLLHPHPSLLLVMLLLAFLMVSRIPYRSFKAAGARQYLMGLLALAIVLLVALVKTGFAVMFMFVTGAMLAAGPAEALMNFLRDRLNPVTATCDENGEGEDDS